MKDIEIWKPIEGYEDYEVSNLGRIKSFKRNKAIIMQQGYQGPNKNYKFVYLLKDGVRKKHLVHRLVAMAFVPNPKGYPVINHKDENPSNNVWTNLEWCTQKYNCNYGTRIKRIIDGESVPIIQFTKDNVIIKVYSSAMNAARDNNCDFSNICKCARGERPTCAGYKWMYLEDYKETVPIQLTLDLQC